MIDSIGAPLLVDLEAIPFVQAKAHGGRRRGAILGVCLHVNEDAALPCGAERLQGKLARGGKVSCHYAVDCDSITQSVRDHDIAFASGPGDDHWIQVELIGRVDRDWQSAFSMAQLALTASLTAALLRRHRCPARRVRAEGLLRSRERGVTGHGDISEASALARTLSLKIAPWWDPTRVDRGYPDNWRLSTNRDPGRAYPWGWFMAQVRARDAHAP